MRRHTRNSSGAGRVMGRLKATYRDPINLLDHSQRERFIQIQLDGSRPAYCGVLLAGAVLLLVLAALESFGWTSGIGYPVWLTAAVGVVLAASGMMTLWVQNPILLGVSLLIYGVGLAAMMSFPVDDTTATLSLRTGLFNLFPIAALSLTVRRRALWMILILILAVAFVRLRLYGPPAGGPPLYWLVIATSVLFGLLLRRFRFNLAVYFFLARDEQRAEARTDALTGLPNRNGWLRQSAWLFEQAGPHRPVSAIFFDVDNFKRVNDTHGHATGDEILRKLADSIRGHLPSGSAAARLGGEEFVVLLSGADAATATAFAERVRTTFAMSARQHDTRVSAGVAQRHPKEPLSSLMRRADESMYAAKLAGRDRVVVAS